MSTILQIENLSKTYRDGLEALKNFSLDIKKGEIFALLGPNGAGKTTLIGCVTGLVNPSAGTIRVDGRDIVADSNYTRSLIGLVPQELHVEVFESVWDTVSFSRGLFGLPANDQYLESILKKLSLWDKRNSSMLSLSGGMKRRVMIAKALSHEPQVLFLDEPTAGVDVELRRDMWKQVKELKDLGVTIILTTHYIEEAEEMADRVAVMNKGEIILTENTKEIMAKFGQKELILDLKSPLEALPKSLSGSCLNLIDSGNKLSYIFEACKSSKSVSALLSDISEAGLEYTDMQIDQRKLEDIFIELVNG